MKKESEIKSVSSKACAQQPVTVALYVVVVVVLSVADRSKVSTLVLDICKQRRKRWHRVKKNNQYEGP